MVKCLKGRDISEKGAVGSELYIVLDGEIKISIGGERLGFSG